MGAFYDFVCELDNCPLFSAKDKVHRTDPYNPFWIICDIFTHYKGSPSGLLSGQCSFNTYKNLKVMFYDFLLSYIFLQYIYMNISYMNFPLAICSNIYINFSLYFVPTDRLLLFFLILNYS